MTIHTNYKYTACSSRICGVSLDSAVECFGQCTTNMCRLVHRALSNYYHFNTFVEKKIKTKWHRGATLKGGLWVRFQWGNYFFLFPRSGNQI